MAEMTPRVSELLVWADEIKRRVDEVRSGKVKLIPGEQVLRELAKELPDEE
jgi:Putative addiction module component